MFDTVFRLLFVVCAFMMLIPGVISIYDQAKVRDYTPISNYTYEYPNTDFKHNGEIINPQAIHYIHTRLDQGLAYEDEFRNNVQLSDYDSSAEDMLSLIHI